MPTNYHLITKPDDYSVWMQGKVTDFRGEMASVEITHYDDRYNAYIVNLPVLSRDPIGGFGSSPVEATSDALRQLARLIVEMAESLGLPKED